MSLLVFSSFSLGVSSRSSRSSGVTKGKFPTLPAVLPPPRLVDEELEVELRPESTTGEACHSRRKSDAPQEVIKECSESTLVLIVMTSNCLADAAGTAEGNRKGFGPLLLPGAWYSVG